MENYFVASFNTFSNVEASLIAISDKIFLFKVIFLFDKEDINRE